METRLKAWEQASQLVASIIAEHGLEIYKGAAPAFSTPSIFTKVDQHIDHIMNVANWLLQGDNNG